MVACMLLELSVGTWVLGIGTFWLSLSVTLPCLSSVVGLFVGGEISFRISISSVC